MREVAEGKRFSARTCVSVLLGAVAAALLTANAFVPVLGVAVLPAVLALVYYLSFRVGWWLPLPVAAVTAALSCIGGVDAFMLGEAVIIALITVPRVFRAKLNLLAEIALCAVIGMAGVGGYLGICAAATDKSVSDVITYEYATCGDPITESLAKKHYASLDSQTLGHEPLSPKDEKYGEEILREYSYSVGRELDGNLLWYVTGFGFFAGAIAPFGAAAIANARKEKAYGKSVSELRLGRWYLIAIAAALLMSALSVFEQLKPVTVTVFNIFITLPTSFAGITVLYHSLRRPPGKVRIVTTVLFWLLIAAAAVFYEWGMVILGFLGLADIILDLRKLLDWALG